MSRRIVSRSSLAQTVLALFTAVRASGQEAETFVVDPPSAQSPPPAEAEISGTAPNGFGSLRINGFFVGSFGYNSGLLIVPDAFGGARAATDPGRTGARFDKFGLGVHRVFSHRLSVSASVQAESHRDRHSHIIAPTSPSDRFGCPEGEFCERFGADSPSIEVALDRFAVTAVAPVGNGLALSLGRFETPFGIERHDENLNLTATTSEIFRYARPQRMTGFQVAYAFSPRFDANAWVVNRWEADDTDEDDFNDNNGGKSVGGRIGFSPLPSEKLLNIGIGGWRGVERATFKRPRSLVTGDVTWSPNPAVVLAVEAVRGTELMEGLRQVGHPVAEPAEGLKRVSWWGYSVIAHYDFTQAFGFSVRHALLDDDRARTGVSQRLRSLTIAPVFHLTALIPGLRPLAVAVPRTAHPYHWADLKLEYRLSQSNREVFGEALPNTSLHDRAAKHSHEVQIQLTVNFQ